MRSYNLLLISFIYVSLSISCQNQITESERKSKMFSEINSKYDSLGFMGISDVDKKLHQIDLYSLVKLNRKNVFDSTKINNYSDSLKKAFFVHYNFTKQEYLADIDSIHSFANWYLDKNRDRFNEVDFKKQLFDVFKANGKLDFDDLIFYFDNLYFKLSPNSKYDYVSNIRKEDVEKWMSNIDGSIISFKESVIKDLLIPDSFEHLETSYLIEDGIAKIRMKYKCENKFGQEVKSIANGVLDVVDGSVKNIKIQ